MSREDDPKRDRGFADTYAVTLPCFRVNPWAKMANAYDERRPCVGR